jgi:hypothetical protein
MKSKESTIGRFSLAPPTPGGTDDDDDDVGSGGLEEEEWPLIISRYVL